MNLVEQLIAKIKNHAEYQQARHCFVSIYRRSQHYGGPEEGGWWYDRTTLEGSIQFPDRAEAEQWLEHAKEEVERMNEEEQPQRNRAMANLPDLETAHHPEGYIPNGWSDGGELFVVVEQTRGECDNRHEPVPHYE